MVMAVAAMAAVVPHGSAAETSAALQTCRIFLPDGSCGDVPKPTPPPLPPPPFTGCEKEDHTIRATSVLGGGGSLLAQMETHLEFCYENNQIKTVKRYAPTTLTPVASLISIDFATPEMAEGFIDAAGVGRYQVTAKVTFGVEVGPYKIGASCNMTIRAEAREHPPNRFPYGSGRIYNDLNACIPVWQQTGSGADAARRRIATMIKPFYMVPDEVWVYFPETPGDPATDIKITFPEDDPDEYYVLTLPENPPPIQDPAIREAIYEEAAKHPNVQPG
jgi:hypothetical protein